MSPLPAMFAAAGVLDASGISMVFVAKILLRLLDGCVASRNDEGCVPSAAPLA